MRKLLSSQGKDHHLTSQLKSDIACVRPKPTLLSNWNVRNDSSKVSALLHPEKTRGSRAEKKCCLSTNTCYCKDGRLKPRLLNRPQKCLRLDQEAERGGIRADLWRGSLKQCQCDGSSVAVMYENSEKVEGTDLMLSEQRKDYEDYRSKETETFFQNLEEFEEKLLDEDRWKEEKSSSTQSVNGHHPSTANSNSGCFNVEGNLDVESMKNFRKDHYFETHSIHDLDKNIPEHVCVHQFRLDERLLPDPVNVDVFGRSRCTFCSKPMEEDNIQLSRSSLSKTSCRTTLKNTIRSCELGLTPKTISFGGRNTKVELKVTDEDLQRYGSAAGRYRPQQYINSFALRYQKMAH